MIIFNVYLLQYLFIFICLNMSSYYSNGTDVIPFEDITEEELSYIDNVFE